MPIQSTDISRAFGNKKRMRTQNYRGSLITNTMALATARGAINADGIALMPIPYSASIKSVKIGCDQALGNSEIAIGIFGINRDYTPGNDGIFSTAALTVIANDVFRANAAIVGANANKQWIELLSPDRTSQTVYDLLCDGDPIIPIANFKPYCRDRYGMLKVTIATADLGQDSYWQVEYVDGSPSTSPMTTLTVER